MWNQSPKRDIKPPISQNLFQNTKSYHLTFHITSSNLDMNHGPQMIAIWWCQDSPILVAISFAAGDPPCGMVANMEVPPLTPKSWKTSIYTMCFLSHPAAPQWSSGWWFFATPSWKMMEFVTWDDDSNPILMGKFKKWQPNHQPVIHILIWGLFQSQKPSSDGDPPCWNPQVSIESHDPPWL